MHEDKDSMFVEPKIVLAVVLITLNKQIDLENLARKTINAHYLKKRFAACIVRRGSIAGLFFTAGSIVLTFKHLKQRDELTSLYMSIARAVDPELEIVNSELVNTNLSCSVNAKLLLNKIRKEYSKKRKLSELSFNSQLFPGMSKKIIVPGNENIKVNLFCSGKFTLTGAKSVEEMAKAYKIAKVWIVDYIKQKKQ